MTSQLIDTPVGTLLAIWTNSGHLRSCCFAENACSSSVEMLDARQLLLSNRFRQYFDSGEIHWDMEQLDWSGISVFHQRVLRCCYEIPAGCTLSYGMLAQRAGRPGAARAVGGAMARNRWPLLIPCHRVVGSSGRLTGYSGTGGIETKRWLLQLESVQSSTADRRQVVLI